MPLAQHTVCLAPTTLSFSTRVLTLIQALIETRGTNEPQGPSNSFKTMNAAIIAQVMGGTEYDVLYPASIDQISIVGTTDVS